MSGELPWLPYLAIEFLECRIEPSWHCFEWGCGGSTLWLAERCESVTSVEHDSAWVPKDLPDNVKVLVVGPEPGALGDDPSNPNHYRSAATNVGDVNWKAYCHAIDGKGEFDLVLIDGRARASCIARAIPHVKNWLLIDNSERSWYFAMPQLNDWERVTFWGHGPELECMWEASAFRR